MSDALPDRDRPTTVRPTAGLAFGGDYNPEQWPPEVWDEDLGLMRRAGVNLVTVGVFSWSRIEPRPGEQDWAWLDEVLDRLHGAGIGVDLATPLAAPPPWLLTAHPEITPLDADMVPRRPGTRLGWCPSSPVFREHARRITTALADRYGRHPAVRLWHLGNELGGGNARCYCEVSAAAFRGWLARRYPDVAAINEAWGTAFWGHLYSDLAQIDPPRDPEQAANPGLVLDYLRFSSDELLGHLRDGAQIVRARSDAPVTTNLMVGAGGHVAAYPTWVPELDVVATDHYTLVDDEHREVDLALSADRVRGLAGPSRAWLLMEHSVGGPSWQQRNRAKDPGEIARNSLAHVARGSDAALFFQWRASLSGAEQFHSAMLPHAGERTRVFREVEQLGAWLGRLSVVQGAPVQDARVAMLMDEESAWMLEYGLKPHRGLRADTEPRRWYRALWDRQVLVDVLPADHDLTGYDVVVVPTVLVMAADRAERIARYVADGGTALVTYLSGVVDEHHRVLLGGYPGALRGLLGVRAEEYRPLQTSEQVTLSDGSVVRDWVEDTLVDDAEVVLTVADGPAAGRAAVTRRRVGAGEAWYVSVPLPPEATGRIVDTLVTEAGLPRVVEAPPGLEAVRRTTPEGPVLFLINHTPADVPVRTGGTELLTGRRCGPVLTVPAGQVAVVQEDES